MSTSTQETAAEQITARAEAAGRPERRRRRVIAVAVLAVVAAGAAAVLTARPFSADQTGAASDAGAAPLATVTDRALSSQTQVNATLGYSGSYAILAPATSGSTPPASGQRAGAGQAGGASSAGNFTALPAVGQVVSQGQSLYSIDGSPTALLYGTVPAYRALSPGMSGADVRQVNADLVTLGDATRSQLDPNSDSFGAVTASALEKLQGNLGLPQTGNLPLGQAVFLPAAVRVTSVSATLGAPAVPGAPFARATSTTRAVIAQLDATQQSEVKVGDRVTITLPDNRTAPGVVTSVGTVATTPSSAGGAGASAGSGSAGSGSTPTIEVDVRPTDPAATGTFDQAPVQVTITTATVHSALVVPVTALLAQPGGAYAVEVAGAGGIRRIVPVSLGLFDDADGLVQVSGSGLSAGQHVVVPTI